MRVTSFRSRSVAGTAGYNTSKEYQGRDGRIDDEYKEIIYFTSSAFRQNAGITRHKETVTRDFINHPALEAARKYTVDPLGLQTGRYCCERTRSNYHVAELSCGKGRTALQLNPTFPSRYKLTSRGSEN